MRPLPRDKNHLKPAVSETEAFPYEVLNGGGSAQDRNEDEEEEDELPLAGCLTGRRELSSDWLLVV